MNNLLRIILILIPILIIAFSCNNSENKQRASSGKIEFQEVIKENYELNKPANNIKGVLVLFAGYPQNATDIKREFTILELAKNNNIAVLYMNYNQKLWMEQHEKLQIAEQLQMVFETHQLPTNNIYIGGFSSGGNVALLVSDFMTDQKFSLTPKGVFIIDSPLDLAELYITSYKNVQRNFSKPSVQESTWLLKTLEEKFGNPNKDISKYEAYSIFTLKTNNIDNIKHLKNTKIRLYTEPDTLWQKKNRMVDYEQMNAYPIKKLSETLNKLKFTDVTYIPTKHKGYRANGKRHPHSWSIVNKNNLIEWMLY